MTTILRISFKVTDSDYHTFDANVDETLRILDEIIDIDSLEIYEDKVEPDVTEFKLEFHLKDTAASAQIVPILDELEAGLEEIGAYDIEEVEDVIEVSEAPEVKETLYKFTVDGDSIILTEAELLEYFKDLTVAINDEVDFDYTRWVSAPKTVEEAMEFIKNLNTEEDIQLEIIEAEPLAGVSNAESNGEESHDVKVKFYIEDCDDPVLAVFPEEDEGNGHVACYSHVGQHSTCDLEYVEDLKEATYDEYKDLLEELKSIGYSLIVLNEDRKEETMTSEDKHYKVHEAIGNYSDVVFESDSFNEVQEYLEKRWQEYCDNEKVGYDDEGEQELFHSYFSIEESECQEDEAFKTTIKESEGETPCSNCDKIKEYAESKGIQVQEVPTDEEDERVTILGLFNPINNKYLGTLTIEENRNTAHAENDMGIISSPVIATLDNLRAIIDKVVATSGVDEECVVIDQDGKVLSVVDDENVDFLDTVDDEDGGYARAYKFDSFKEAKEAMERVELPEDQYEIISTKQAFSFIN